jgi:hypothetical protein
MSYLEAMEKLRMELSLGTAGIARFGRSSLLAILPMVCGVLVADAQEPSGALPEVVQGGVPFYPPNALAARISGEVHLHLSTDGKVVTAITGESGPAILVKAAKENVGTWRFAEHAATSFDATFKYKLTDSAKCEIRGGIVVLHLPKEVEVDGFTLPQCDMVRFARQQKFLMEQHVYPVELAIMVNGKLIELPREVTISNGTESAILPTVDGMFLVPEAMRGGAPLIFRTVIGKELIEVKGIPATALEAAWKLTLSDSESSPELDLPKGMNVKSACSIAFSPVDGDGTAMTVGVCRKPIE